MTTAVGDDRNDTDVGPARRGGNPPPDFTIRTLGTARITSPMAAMLEARRTTEHYVNEADRILYDDTLAGVSSRDRSVDLPSMEPGGPRAKIFFDPSKTRVAIVTCGGLCPGLNDVIAGLVRTLTYHYQVRRVIGIRNGYQGFVAAYGHDVVELTPETVRDRVTDGGTMLGTATPRWPAPAPTRC
jgi:6-phosphofructokinase 1